MFLQRPDKTELLFAVVGRGEKEIKEVGKDFGVWWKYVYNFLIPNKINVFLFLTTDRCELSYSDCNGARIY